MLRRLALRPEGTNNTHLIYTKVACTQLLGQAQDRGTPAHHTGEVDQPGMGQVWAQLLSGGAGEVEA